MAQSLRQAYDYWQDQPGNYVALGRRVADNEAKIQQKKFTRQFSRVLTLRPQLSRFFTGISRRSRVHFFVSRETLTVHVRWSVPVRKHQISIHQQTGVSYHPLYV
jgi:hypothetical protein